MKSLSHSSWDEYLTCPRKYKIRKRLCIIDDKISSALVFGSVLDNCFNALLLDKELPSIRLELQCLKDGSHSFYKGDFDYDLVPIDLQNYALENAKSNGYSGNLSANDLFNVIWKKIMDNGKDFNSVTLAQQSFIAELSYYSLSAKALLMVEAYKTKILPLVIDVKGVQVECTSRSGFIDVIANLKGYGLCVIDNKTSSRRYSDDKINFAPQLLNYADDQKIDRVMFIVVVKQIKKNKEKQCKVCNHKFHTSHTTCPSVDKMKKRCGGEVDVYIEPECDIQILCADVNKVEQKEVVASFKEVGELIQKDVFPKNLRSCADQFGKPCIYYNYCRNGSMKNLKESK